MFDVLIAIVFGLIGFGMKKFGYPGAPLVLGLILGPIAEENLNRALVISNNDWSVFVTRPISCIFLLISAASIVYAIYTNIRDGRKELAEKKG